MIDIKRLTPQLWLGDLEEIGLRPKYPQTGSRALGGASQQSSPTARQLTAAVVGVGGGVSNPTLPGTRTPNLLIKS